MRAENVGSVPPHGREHQESVGGEQGCEEGEEGCPLIFVEMGERPAAPDEIERALELDVLGVMARVGGSCPEYAGAEVDSVRPRVARGQRSFGEGSLEHPQYAPKAATEVENALEVVPACLQHRKPYGSQGGAAGREVRSGAPVHPVGGRDLLD